MNYLQKCYLSSKYFWKEQAFFMHSRLSISLWWCSEGSAPVIVGFHWRWLSVGERMRKPSKTQWNRSAIHLTLMLTATQTRCQEKRLIKHRLHEAAREKMIRSHSHELVLNLHLFDHTYSDPGPTSIWTLESHLKMKSQLFSINMHKTILQSKYIFFI